MTRAIRTAQFKSSTAAAIPAVGCRPAFSSPLRILRGTGSRRFGAIEWRRAGSVEQLALARAVDRQPSARSRKSVSGRASWAIDRRRMPSRRWLSSHDRSTSAGSAPITVRAAVAGTRPRKSEVGQQNYSDKRWRRTRRRYLRENPICEEDGCEELSTDVHHKDGQGHEGPAGHDWSNLEGLCHSHHSKRTAKEKPSGWHRHSRRSPSERHPGSL